MSSNFGNAVKIQIFGQSHSEGLGVVIDGLPAGFAPDMDAVQRFMARRAPGQGAYTTKRRESDAPRILSGLVEGTTCGAPLCAVFENSDTRSQDYEQLRALPRPAHADYPAYVKTHGCNDIRGGGHFSARLTAPLVFAGALCVQLLARRGVTVGAHIAAVAQVLDTPYDPVELTAQTLAAAGRAAFPVLDEAAGARMRAAIAAAAKEGDSVGGVVECGITGLPAGLGEPIFDGLENRIAAAVFGIPAVKGIEFGAGFAAAAMRGSENNDPFYYDTAGAVKTRTNHHGGILGGLASGMPLVFRAAFKPTPSIVKPQRTVNLLTGQDSELVIRGRHDPCVVPRAVPCVEAAAAVAVYDLMRGAGLG